MRHVVFCCDKAASCFLVEAVNDARPFFSTDTRQSRAVVQQRVDQRVFAVTRSWMNRHASGFVDDDEIGVFEQNLQWNRFRSGLDFFRWRIRELNFIACSYKLVWSGGCSVETNQAGTN